MELSSPVVGETCDMMYRGRKDYIIGDNLGKSPQGYFRDMCNPRSRSMYNNPVSPALKSQHENVDVSIEIIFYFR